MHTAKIAGLFDRVARQLDSVIVFAAGMIVGAYLMGRA